MSEVVPCRFRALTLTLGGPDRTWQLSFDCFGGGVLRLAVSEADLETIVALLRDAPAIQATDGQIYVRADGDALGRPRTHVVATPEQAAAEGVPMGVYRAAPASSAATRARRSMASFGAALAAIIRWWNRGSA